MSELKPCPFCECEMELVTVGRDWFRIKPVDGHDDFCPFGDQHEWDCSQSKPEWKSEHINDWNQRAETETERRLTVIATKHATRADELYEALENLLGSTNAEMVGEDGCLYWATTVDDEAVIEARRVLDKSRIEAEGL